jgi:hypothetical protein
MQNTLTMNKPVLVILFLSIVIAGFTQNTGNPPSASMPTAVNKTFIDKLISESRFEDFFKDYCTTRITREGNTREWTKERTQKAINRIDYEDFKWDMYNYFSLFTNGELIEMTKLVSKLNKKQVSSFCFITTPSFHTNLDLIVEEYLKEE